MFSKANIIMYYNAKYKAENVSTVKIGYVVEQKL